MSDDDTRLTNHEITVCLQGGAILGPFRATWSTDIVSDVRELSKDYDAFMQGEKQLRFKYHLHDPDKHVSHSLIINFEQVTAIYDKVDLQQD
jgi:phosphorylcholine metabolism protein LicD